MMKGKNNKNIPYRLYIVIGLIVYVSLSVFVFPEDLDIIRYYESVINATKSNIDFEEYLTSTFELSKDFIYYISLFTAYKILGSLNIVTTIYISLYYICCLELFRRNGQLIQTNGLIVFYALMCAPYVWIIEISRNLAAISLLYIAILNLLHKNSVKALFFFAMSILTHISMIIYFPIMFAAYMLSKKATKINAKCIVFVFFILCILGYLLPNTIVDGMALIAGGADTRYSYYASYENIIPLVSTNISYGDKVPMLFVFFYSLVVVFINKNHDFFFWMLFILTAMLSFALFSSLMLTNRIIMLMPFFIIGNICSILNSNPNIRIVNRLSFLGIICIVIHIYSYRTAFCL